MNDEVQKQLFYDEIDLRHEKKSSFWSGFVTGAGICAITGLLVIAFILH